VAEPQLWGNSVLFHPEMRDEFQQLLDSGLVDVFRRHHPDAQEYSWWDYQRLAFPRNHGLRIDHILATKPAAEVCRSAWIDRDARQGKQPSDHAPVLAEFKR
jgi:exodeoxyribonuclease-3